MEVIAVDDGSTDGTGECLEEFAGRAPMPVTVIRQANSGGPSGPRNIGLDRATGRYVFFLDADDRLGHEALQRMVAMADRAGTDVVLGRVEGVNRAPRSPCGAAPWSVRTSTPPPSRTRSARRSCSAARYSSGTAYGSTSRCSPARTRCSPWRRTSGRTASP
ncbi:glycosyltransferase family 2 protein [Streptomyces sp. INA 01156]